MNVKVVFVLLAVLACALAVPQEAPADGGVLAPTGRAWRLPTALEPVHYDLWLQPHLAAATYDGKVEVELRVVADTSVAVLNAKELTVESVSVTSAGGTRDGLAFTFFPDVEQLEVHLGATHTAGETLRLAVVFHGVLNDDMNGFYRSTFTDDEGEHVMAASHFEPTDARRAFPCWDEPAFKATFTVRMAKPPHLTALSNMPVERVETLVAGELEEVHFARSVRMSTYLVAFVVGSFDHVEARVGNVSVRVFTRPGRADEGKLALDTATRVLPHFEQVFGVAYPLPKLDLIGIPDFSAGAMENWGLITFRESTMYYKEGVSSASTRQRVAVVVAHELAHQWFGNLVTMKWWDELWLNEGFATYMEYAGVDAVYPEWGMWDFFLTQDVQAAMGTDALHNTHPIAVEVNGPGEINEIFDSISYSKGASVIRMLRDYIGQDAFRAGLKLYLSRHAFHNAESSDLWAAWSEATGHTVDVAAIARSWTEASGFPLVEVRQSSHGLELYQHRYTLLPDEAPCEGGDALWQVPVSVRTEHHARDELPKRLLTAQSQHFPLPHDGKWFVLNAGRMGLYRVTYPPHRWEFMADAWPHLDQYDRFGMLTDAFSLALTGRLPVHVPLELVLRHMPHETSYLVWKGVSSYLRTLARQLHGSDMYVELERLIGTEVLTPLVHRVGWHARDGEAHQDKVLRALVLAEAAYYGNGEVVAECRRRYAALMDAVSAAAVLPETDKCNTAEVQPDHTAALRVTDPAIVPHDLLRTVAATAVRMGGEAEYSFAVQKFKHAEGPAEKNDWLSAVAAPRDQALLQRSLQMALTDDVRDQDASTLVESCALNRHGLHMSWAFVKERWADFDARFGQHGGAAFSEMVADVTDDFASKDMHAEVKAFFDAHPEPSVQRVVLQSLERILVNERFAAHTRLDVEAWLVSHKQ